MFYYRMMMVIAGVSLITTPFAAETVNPLTKPATAHTQSVSVKPSAVSVNTLKVNMNEATFEELIKVKGLSKSKAKNIISYRKKQGNFKSVEELNLVKGFKKMNNEKLKAVQEQLTVHSA